MALQYWSVKCLPETLRKFESTHLPVSVNRVNLLFENLLAFVDSRGSCVCSFTYFQASQRV